MEVVSDMNKLCLVCDASHRHYNLPEKVVAEFNSRPPEKRMATLGWPEIGQNAAEPQCGAIEELRDTCGHIETRVEVDPSLPGGKELKALIRDCKTLVCGLGGLGGYGHCEGEIAVMDSIEYVAVSEPQDVPR